MTINTLKDLYIEQLQDTYDAERQLVEKMPQMIEHANHPELRDALQKHLEETKSQRKRLEQVFEKLGEKPKEHHCEGMAGLIKEGEEFIQERVESDVRDAALITAQQRAEHYEIAAYGTLRAYAQLMDRQEDHDILSQSLEEEKKTDQILNDIAIKVVNPDAAAVR